MDITAYTDRSQAYGALLLRVSLGTVLLAHSLYLKLMVFTLAGTAQFFGSIGLPEWLAYLVFAMEVVGGTLLILGVQVRAVGLALLPILLGATWAHSGNGWLFTAPNGGWEYPLFLAAMSASVALLGAGAHALAPALKRNLNPVGGKPTANAG
ncbi:MAG TPA: DoxX family protein [Pseudomonas sp.]|nr:DoxX family protein [Pseudomonas sp.]